MTRTQVLQEIRRMRFNEAYGGWQERRLTQEEAARLLGVCERTFRRYVDRYSLPVPIDPTDIEVDDARCVDLAPFDPARLLEAA